MSGPLAMPLPVVPPNREIRDGDLKPRAVQSPRPVRLTTDGLRWRVEVLDRVRRWPWFWLWRDVWQLCGVMTMYPIPYYSTDEVEARAAYARVVASEAAQVRGYRTVEETGGSHRAMKPVKPRGAA